MKRSNKSYFKSFETLTVDRFYKIQQTEDYRYLIKDFDGFEELKLQDGEEVELESIWEEVREDYVSVVSQGKGRSDMLILGRISDMETEIMVVGSILLMMHKTPTEGLKSCLKDWKYNADNLEKAEKKLNGTKFKLDMLKSKNKHLFEQEDSKKIEYDLYKDVVLLEQALDGLTIDVRTTVVAKWANYLVVAEMKNKKKESHGK